MGPTEERTWISRSEEETVDRGRRIAERLQAGDVVALEGPLGSGKTHLAKGLALGLGVGDPDRVVSPTFVYLRIHEGRVPLYHLDAYRLRGAAEFEALGGWEMLGEDGVSVIEWSDRIANRLPPDRYQVGIRIQGPRQREIRLRALGRCADQIEGFR